MKQLKQYETPSIWESHMTCFLMIASQQSMDTTFEYDDSDWL